MKHRCVRSKDAVVLAVVKDDGLRLAQSRHPLTAAARAGARDERPGRGNGSAGAEPENVGGVVQSGAAEDFRFPFPHAVENSGSGTGSQWGVSP